MKNFVKSFVLGCKILLNRSLKRTFIIWQLPNCINHIKKTFLKASNSTKRKFWCKRKLFIQYIIIWLLHLLMRNIQFTTFVNKNWHRCFWLMKKVLIFQIANDYNIKRDLLNIHLPGMDLHNPGSSLFIRMGKFDLPV